VYFPNLYPGLADTSGSAVLCYDGFVSQNAGAKDTWGENYFQIEGEKGYLYIEGGSNGIAKVRVVTKDTEEVFDAQPDPDRWSYEVKEIARLVLAGKRQVFRDMLETTADVMETLEACRESAGIRFPEDGEQ